MRSKEEAHDYRYFPDPIFCRSSFDPDWVEAIRVTLPELPDEKKRVLSSNMASSPTTLRCSW